MAGFLRDAEEGQVERTLPPLPENQALSEEEVLRRLEALLKPRLERAGTSVEQIFADVRHELRP